MDRAERVFLNEGQIIELSYGDEKKVNQRFKILGVAGQGASSVCYRAQRISDGKIGHLKEFYPADYSSENESWYYSMYRQNDGQLYCSKDYEKRFKEACEDYLNGYRLLNEAIANHPECLVLKNYVQNCEILYGGVAQNQKRGLLARMAEIFSDQSEELPYATVYIWSVGLEGETFDQYLSKVRNNPSDNPGLRLNEILNALISLTDAIKVFHTAGLLHLDIKPANFMVALDSERHVNASNISIFDIDAIYSFDSDKRRCNGTKGFRAPELAENSVDHRADLYSIGAVLFNAIVVSDDIPDSLYRDSYYDQIDQLVKHSKLIENSDAGNDVHLLLRLANILKKCLAYQYKQRYECASDLLEDLKDAEDYSKIYAISSERLGHNRKVKIIHEEQKGITDPKIVIQKLLYEHPLFELAPSKDGTIQALTIGCGTYGQQFIDTCLQAGQMKDHRISVTAVSANPVEDKDSYLRFRPELSRFVSVTGETVQPGGEPLGTLRFIALRKAAKGFTGESPQFRTEKDEKSLKENRKLVHQIVQNLTVKNQKLNYVFIALGNDQLNYTIAQLFSDELSDSKNGLCPVCYVSGRKRGVNKKALQNKLYPVCINEPIAAETIDPLLEQMAFNTHLVWNGFNHDIREVLNQFRGSKYDYESSMAFVLSLKYKLYSIGIKDEDPEEAAKRFNDEVLSLKAKDKGAENKINTLTALEHQRWLLYMAADGWKLPRDSKGNLSLDECIKIGKAKNSANRTHACMLPCRPDALLSSAVFERNNKAKWDDPNIDPALDDLDRMSVQMHQMYQKQAAYLKRNDLFHEADLKMILTMIPRDDKKVSDACRHYRFCIRNILSGAEGYSKYFEEYERNLLKEVDQSIMLSEPAKAEIRNRIDLIHKTMIPVIHANEYLDYKKIDEDLIEQIPFILTYRSLPSLAMAFEVGQSTDGRNEEIFRNVASATVLRPGSIRYYYLFDQKSEEDLLVKKITSVLNYLHAQKINCNVSMMIALSSKMDQGRKTMLKQAMKELMTVSDRSDIYKLQSADYVEYDSPEQISEYVIQDLSAHQIDLFDGSVKLFGSARRDGVHIDRIISSCVRYFEFESSSQTFAFTSNCEYLKYLHTGAYIRIDDMFALMGASPSGFNLPEYAEDYEKLWDIYTGSYLEHNNFERGVANWNSLCGILEDYEKSKEPIASFPIRKTDPYLMTTQVYYLPAYTLYQVRKVLQRMISEKVIGQESKIYTYTSDDCQAEIVASKEVHEVMQKFFGRTHLLMGSYDPITSIKKEETGMYFRVERSDLRVEGVNLEIMYDGMAERLIPLLKILNKENFITNFKVDENNPKRVSFTYASSRFKKLLTKAGEILEIYVYFEILKQGYFDDIATGYELEWAEGGVGNELDLVLTKGFRSIIAECKAVRELGLNYYHKLDSLANMFGIGNICILIGNTYKSNDQRLAEINAMQRSRGNQLNIITVSEEKDIRNIGQILVDIMRREIKNGESK